MRKNCREVMHAWSVSKRKRACDSIWTENGTVYSYRTAIAQRRYDSIVHKWLFFVNMTKYSTTTTIHQNAIYAMLQKLYPDAIFVVFDDLPFGVQSLKEHYPSNKYNYYTVHREAA